MVYNSWYFCNLPESAKEKPQPTPHNCKQIKRKFDDERLRLLSKALTGFNKVNKPNPKEINDLMLKANHVQEVFTRAEFSDLIRSQKRETDDLLPPQLIAVFKILFGNCIVKSQDQKKYETSRTEVKVSYNEERDTFTVTYDLFPSATFKEFVVLSVLESRALNKVTSALLDRLSKEENSYAIIKKRGVHGEELPFLLLVNKHNEIVRYHLKIDDQGLAFLTAVNIAHHVFQKTGLQIKYGPGQLLKVLNDLGCYEPITSPNV